MLASEALTEIVDTVSRDTPTPHPTNDLANELVVFFGSLGMSARDVAESGSDFLVQAAWWTVGCKRFRNLRALTWYDDWYCRNPGGKRRRGKRGARPMHVDNMVDRWFTSILQLSTGHTHAERTQAEHDSDDLLTPLSSAPISQVREWAQKLGARLEADERVPYMIWSGWRRLLEPVIVQGPDGPAIQLQHELAQRIAREAGRRLEPQEWIDAMAGALQWRPQGQLEKMDKALRANPGAQPRVTGGESCLFLELPTGPGPDDLEMVVL